ncbi:MAG: PQQ-binding-like beta-propeller repeat protein [Verrucomicrobiales bacterium]|nr:PQQ-binding-like beta-propeller repeat protein [Verrucomicrobiales bacterium]
MKQILLMIAVVALVGCGKKEPAQPSVSNSTTSSGFEETKAKAEAGNVDAQYNLGEMYRKGEGVEQDFKEVVKWYQKAAGQGNAPAQSNLGVMYYNGKGVEQDFKEAVKWYQKAADQGNTSAQSNLGFMYANGKGVEQDFKEAVKWYQKAADQGNTMAQYSLEMMFKLWEFKTGDAVGSSPAIGSDGTVYVGSGNKLFAIKTDSKGLAKSPWPMRGQNARHTGRAPAKK